MTGEERRNSMEREISSDRSSSRGAGEPSSSVASSSVAVAGEDANAHVHVRESAAAAEQSGPVRESVPTDHSADEDVKWEDVKRDLEPDQLLFLMKKSAHRPQSDDGGNSKNNFGSNNNSTVGGCGVVAAGVVVDAIIPACNGTVSDEKKEKSSKKKNSRGNRSAHTCEKCGKTFATGQSLGGHMRKHYDIQKLTDKKRAREKQKETTAPAVERRVQEPAALTGYTVAAMVKIEEERTASSCSAPLESHNPTLLLQSVQLEGLSAANGARRPHDFDLNKPAANGASHPHDFDLNEPAASEEEERKDDDSDNALLSFRLRPKFDSHRSN